MWRTWLAATKVRRFSHKVVLFSRLESDLQSSQGLVCISSSRFELCSSSAVFCIVLHVVTTHYDTILRPLTHTCLCRIDHLCPPCDSFLSLESFISLNATKKDLQLVLLLDSMNYSEVTLKLVPTSLKQPLSSLQGNAHNFLSKGPLHGCRRLSASSPTSLLLPVVFSVTRRFVRLWVKAKIFRR